MGCGVGLRVGSGVGSGDGRGFKRMQRNKLGAFGFYQ